MRTIISDSSCLISLSNAGELELLKKVFREVTITPTIAKEFKQSLPSWIKIIPNGTPIQYAYGGIDLDPGEASAISLALELGNALLIVDDFQARKVTEMLSLEFMGTIRVVVEAKKQGHIASVRMLLSKLREAGLYFSKDLEQRALSDANELEESP